MTIYVIINKNPLSKLEVIFRADSKFDIGVRKLPFL